MLLLLSSLLLPTLLYHIVHPPLSWKKVISQGAPREQFWISFQSQIATAIAWGYLIVLIKEPI